MTKKVGLGLLGAMGTVLTAAGAFYLGGKYATKMDAQVHEGETTLDEEKLSKLGYIKIPSSDDLRDSLKKREDRETARKSKIDDARRKFEAIDDILCEKYVDKYGEIARRYPYLALYIDVQYGSLDAFKEDFASRMDISEIVDTHAALGTMKPINREKYGKLSKLMVDVYKGCFDYIIPFNISHPREMVVAYFETTGTLINERLISEVASFRTTGVNQYHYAKVWNIDTCFDDIHGDGGKISVDEILEVYPRDIFLIPKSDIERICRMAGIEYDDAYDEYITFQKKED